MMINGHNIVYLIFKPFHREKLLFYQQVVRAGVLTYHENPYAVSRDVGIGPSDELLTLMNDGVKITRLKVITLFIIYIFNKTKVQKIEEFDYLNL